MWLPRHGQTVATRSLRKRLLTFGHNLTDGVVASAVNRLVPLRRRPEPILREAPADGFGKKVAIFCHYSSRGSIAPHSRTYITALRSAGCSVVVTSNSGRLSEEDTTWLRAQRAGIVVRPNSGLDFAAWRDVILGFDLPRNGGDELLLILNDSVYGPLASLDAVLSRLDFDAADIWGICDSWQRRYHLQSFFVAFGPRAVRHPAFTAFWRAFPEFRTKRQVIEHGEIGLTQSMMTAGLRCRALWTYEMATRALHARNAAVLQDQTTPTRTLVEHLCVEYDKILASAASRRVPMNPTADLWRTMLLLGMPFLKRELLRYNPAQVLDITAWQDLVEQISPEWVDLIRSDLTKILHDTSP